MCSSSVKQVGNEAGKNIINVAATATGGTGIFWQITKHWHRWGLDWTLSSLVEQPITSKRQTSKHSRKPQHTPLLLSCVFARAHWKGSFISLFTDSPQEPQKRLNALFFFTFFEKRGNWKGLKMFCLISQRLYLGKYLMLVKEWWMFPANIAKKNILGGKFFLKKTHCWPLY